MNILHVAYYTFLSNLRDRKNFIRRLVMPLLLTLILGTALHKVFAPVDLGKTTVAFLNEDSGSISQNFDDFLKIDKIKELLDVKTVKSMKEGQDMVNKGDATAFLYLDSNYSSDIQKGNKANVTIYSTQESNGRIVIVKSIIDSFINGANTIQAEGKMGAKQAFDTSDGAFQEVPIAVSGKKPGSMDYYGVTMLVLACMAGALYGSDEMSLDYVGHIGRRMRISPIRTAEHFIGKVLGCVFLIMLQAAVVFCVSKFVFKANYGDNYGMLLLVVFSLSVFSTGLGVMMCMLAKDQVRSTSLLNLIVPFFTFIGGGYVKLDLSDLMYLSPSYLAQTAIFNGVYGGSSAQTAGCVLALWGLVVVTFVISLVGARRKLSW